MVYTQFTISRVLILRGTTSHVSRKGLVETPRLEQSREDPAHPVLVMRIFGDLDR